jgi:cytoskeleton protein RodZ
MADKQMLDNVNDDENANAAAKDLGSILQAARLEKRLSQQDVSNSLRYSVKQIDAVENNEFNLLPDAMMTRGFIRSYAKYLQIEAEPLLAAYRNSLGDDSQKVISVKSSMRPVSLTKESLPWLKYILTTIVVLLFLLAWMAYVEYMPAQDVEVVVDKALNSIQTEAKTKLEPSASSTATVLPEIALPVAEREAERDASLAVIDTATSQLSGSSANIAAGPSASAQSLPTTPAAQPLLNDKQNSAATKTITFTFSGQSWVNITDQSGKVVYEKLAQSGDVETITVRKLI